MRRLFIPKAQHPNRAAVIAQKTGCLVTSTGWWTYEYCFGDFVRQFHEQDGVVADEHIIGLSGAALEEDSLARDLSYDYQLGGMAPFIGRIRRTIAEGGDGQQRAVPPSRFACSESLTTILKNKEAGAVVFREYVQGSMCTTEGGPRPRKATVFYICDAAPTQPDPARRTPIFFDIAETAPCEYQLFIRGDAMCSIMNMVPPQAPEVDVPVAAPRKAAAAKAKPKVQAKIATKLQTKAARAAARATAAVLGGEGARAVLVNDPDAEAFEAAPQAAPTAKTPKPKSSEKDVEDDKEADKGEEGAAEQQEDEEGHEEAGRGGPYALGLDDPEFFADSFIMSV